MTEHVTIPIFSSGWWLGFWITALAILIIIWYARTLDKTKEPIFRKILAWIYLGREILHQIVMITAGTWSLDVSLPLQLCGISSMISIYLLFKPRQTPFEFLALLGLAGAIHSFLTPELTHGGTVYHYIEYYVSHGGIVMTALYMHFVLGMRPNVRSWLNVFLWGNGVLLIVGTINYLFSANYIYLCTPPMADNPLIFGPWPYYIIGFEVAGLIHIFLLYKLFRRSFRLAPVKKENLPGIND